MTRYEIAVLRTDDTHELYPLDQDDVPAPPDSGDWVLDDVHTIKDMSTIAEIEVGPPLVMPQDAKPWVVHDVTFHFSGAASGSHRKAVDSDAPTIPTAVTWWAMKASRGDLDDCNRKCDLYLRLAHLDSITSEETPTTCT